MTPYADGRLMLHPGTVARLTLNAPERRNAVSRAMWQALPAALAAIAADSGIRAVLLLAAPAADAIFSAGADISEFAETYATPASTAHYNALVRTAQARLRELPQPVIAVIAGACLGGGCGLALAADLRFAAPEARFAIPAARLGLGYSPADIAQLVEKIGPARARDMLFSARMVAAEEALQIGLIDRILPATDLLAAAESYASGLAALSQASIRTSKAAINRLTAPDPAVCAALEADFAACFSGPDFAEGRAAFLEKRAPQFP